MLIKLLYFKPVCIPALLSLLLVCAEAHDLHAADENQPQPVLVQPEALDFVYKFGAGGFMRGEGAENFLLRDYSYKPNDSEGHFIYRVKPYAYWHPSDYLDIHAEGQAYGFDGGQDHFHRTSLYQGFAEARLPQSDRISLKAGRQDFCYGSAFILGPDSFFDGLSFDALRLRVKPRDNVTVDLFGGNYARSFSGGISGSLSGIYATLAFSEGTAVEAYAIRDSGAAVRRDGEKLYNFGLRGTTVAGPLTLELEPVYQSGDIFSDSLSRNVPVNAYGGHADATVAIPVAGYNSKLLLGYAYGSGDRDSVAGIGAGKEFRNQNNDSCVVGDMSMVADLSGITVGDSHASGLQIYALGWGVDVLKELNFSAASRYFVANKVPAGFSKQIGLETDFSLTYAFNSDLSVLLGYDHFFTGKFFRDASGKNDGVDYGYLMFQFNLSGQKARSGKS